MSSNYPPHLQNGNLIDGSASSAKDTQLFRINDSRLSPTPALDFLVHQIDSVARLGLLRRITIDGYSSPDGPRALNARLAGDRARALRDYIIAGTQLPDSAFTVNGVGEDWEGLRSAVAGSTTLEGKDAALAVLDSDATDDAKEARLRSMRRTWRQLCTDIFPPLRRSAVRIVTETRTYNFTIDSEAKITREEPKEPEAPVVEEVKEVEKVEIIAPVDTVVEVVEVVEEVEEIVPCVPDRSLVLKTNAAAWAMLAGNLAIEYDFAPQWSVALPVYYSALNYFTERSKFRTLALRPEARRWFKPRECGAARRGFYAEAHLGMAWYNFALRGSSTRYQDHKGHTPAFGGGIGAGYRMPLGGSRWGMEFALGFGVYRLHYDKFENVDHIPSGALKGERRKTVFIPDNVAVTFTYTFDFKRKENRR